MVIHTPVLVPHLSRQASRVGAASMASSSAVCASCTQKWRISPLTYLRSMAWSPVLNYICPQISVTRCHVMTNEAVQFSHTEIVGLEISSPACLTSRRVIPHIGTSVVATWKRIKRKNFPWPPPQGGTTPRCVGWHAGRNSTPTGGNLKDHHKLSEDVGALPRPTTLPSMSITPPSTLTTLSLTPCHWWRCQGSGLRWPPALPLLRRINPFSGHSTGRRPT